MTTIEQIKELISQGKTEKALNLLMEYAKAKGGNAEQQALLLSGQYKQWKHSSVIGVEQSKNDLRRIELGILQALESQTPRSFTAASIPPAKKKSILPILAIVFGVIGISLAAWSMLGNSADKQTAVHHPKNDKPTEVVTPATTPENTKSTAETDNEKNTAAPVAPTPKPFQYSTVDLAGLTWMTENLNENTSNSVCYQDDNYNCTLQGRLYTWASAQKACQALGDGWRLPTAADWKKLTRMYGGAYGDLNYDGKTAYQQLSKGGSTGFNGALSGKRIFFPDQQTFYYYDFNTIGYYWADEADANNPAHAKMVTFRSTDNMVLYEGISNTDFISCRCVK